MSTNSTTKEYRLSQWFPIVKTCRESGMTDYSGSLIPVVRYINTDDTRQ